MRDRHFLSLNRLGNESETRVGIEPTLKSGGFYMRISPQTADGRHTLRDTLAHRGDKIRPPEIRPKNYNIEYSSCQPKSEKAQRKMLFTTKIIRTARNKFIDID